MTKTEQDSPAGKRKDNLTEAHGKFLSRLKILRDEKGWSQKNAALLLGMKPTSYSDLEQGAKRVDLDKILKLAELFDVSVGFLIAGERGDLTDAQMERINNRFNL